MFTKNQIEIEKLDPGSPFFQRALAPTRDEATLLFVLKNLGKLPKGFKGALLFCCLHMRTQKSGHSP